MPAYNFGLISVISSITRDMGSIDLGSDTDARRYAIGLLADIPNRQIAAGMYEKGIAVVRIEKNYRKQISTIVPVGPRSYADIKTGKYGDVIMKPIKKDGTYKTKGRKSSPFGL